MTTQQEVKDFFHREIQRLEDAVKHLRELFHAHHNPPEVVPPGQAPTLSTGGSVEGPGPVTPTEKPPLTPVPLPSANPFIGYKTLGLTLEQVILRIGHAPSEEDWAMMGNAGYERPTERANNEGTTPTDLGYKYDTMDHVTATLQASGQNISFTGNGALRLMIPTGWKGTIEFGSGPSSDPNVTDATVYLNGAFGKARPNASAVHTHQVVVGMAAKETGGITLAPGADSVEYSIAQGTASRSFLYFHSYPEL